LADITLSFVPWDIGTTVRAYQRKSELMMPDMPPPAIPSEATGVVAVDKSLALTGLVPDRRYWAIGVIGAVYRYVAFIP
jgi:hypothetical protein